MSDNNQVLHAWIKIGVESPIMEHRSEHDILTLSYVDGYHIIYHIDISDDRDEIHGRTVWSEKNESDASLDEAMTEFDRRVEDIKTSEL